MLKNGGIGRNKEIKKHWRETLFCIQLCKVSIKRYNIPVYDS